MECTCTKCKCDVLISFPIICTRCSENQHIKSYIVSYRYPLTARSEREARADGVQAIRDEMIKELDNPNSYEVTKNG